MVQIKTRIAGHSGDYWRGL